MAATPSRRDRVRAATVTEIKETARRILVSEGPDGLSLRAIAREMGMTAPALYRYFPSREDLITALIAGLYDELATAIEAARDAAAADPDQRRLPELLRPLVGASRGFRRWALAHPREFGLVFGSPIPGIEIAEADDDDPAHRSSRRFGRIFGELIGTIYLVRPFPVPAEEELPASLRADLVEWAHGFPVEVPIGATQVLLSCWIRLYGAVAMEVFGHLRFALSDAEQMFELELYELAGKLGFDVDRPKVSTSG